MNRLYINLLLPKEYKEIEKIKTNKLTSLIEESIISITGSKPLELIKVVGDQDYKKGTVSLKKRIIIKNSSIENILSSLNQKTRNRYILFSLIKYFEGIDSKEELKQLISCKIKNKKKTDKEEDKRINNNLELLKELEGDFA